ncbi:hypothetical protein O7606_21925 [Micromonospora sp. WMMD882]|uniref:hypothetical protein n=1 Tax=Micromonospora sp. WMMD882 TaxID=3015151 RepID=UPI00248BA598|nr:hypothetical protein [Micromonospora sp. WMMD882]WBB78835.1 hypothetical protein O7606_21925 [Micromonospora sp. WMMD882]
MPTGGGELPGAGARPAEPVRDRTMRDPGRLAVLLAAPALALFVTWGEPQAWRTGLRQLRRDARDRPRDVATATAATLVRAASWFYLTVASIVLIVVARSGGPAPPAVTSVAVHLAMFTTGATVAALGRLYLTMNVGERPFPVAGVGPVTVDDRTARLLRRAVTPSWLDAGFALWFAVEVGGAVLG